MQTGQNGEEGKPRGGLFFFFFAGSSSRGDPGRFEGPAMAFDDWYGIGLGCVTRGRVVLRGGYDGPDTKCPVFGALGI